MPTLLEVVPVQARGTSQARPRPVESTPRAGGIQFDRAAVPCSGAPLSRATALCVALGTLLAACGPQRHPQAGPIEATSSRVDVFLRCTDPTSRRVTIELDGAELREATGESRALTVSAARVASTDAARRVPLAGAIVPPSNYSSLVLHVKAAWLEREGGDISLELLPIGSAAEEPSGGAGRSYEIPVQLRLDRRDAASLFVDWRVGDSLTGGAGFSPSFSVSGERPRTTAGVLYVADAGSGSVLAIDRGTGQIVGTFKAGASPIGLALTRDRGRLYVANSGDGSLNVIDVRNGTIEQSIPIGFSARTSDVVLADPQRFVAAANTGLDTITLVSLGLGAQAQTISVGRSPVRLAAAPSLQRLFVVEAEANSVSVIDLNSRAVAARLAVQEQPSDACLDRDEAELYVAHTTSQNLLVFDARSLAQKASIFVGGGVTAVLADARRSRIYLARSRPNELVVVERRLAAIVRRIPVSGRIAALAQSREGDWLYGAAPEAGSLIVVDLVVGKEEPPIRCGSRPSDVVVAE